MTNNRQNITSGSQFEEKIGYSRAVVCDGWVFVSGTTGYDYSDMSISDDVVEQTAQCIKNIENTLQQAGASLDDVVRVNYIYPNKADFEPCWPVLKAAFSQAKPAATMIAAGLLDEKMKVEIEVTARVSGNT